jgi:hypothetical protein
MFRRLFWLLFGAFVVLYIGIKYKIFSLNIPSVAQILVDAKIEEEEIINKIKANIRK